MMTTNDNALIGDNDDTALIGDNDENNDDTALI